jgi:ATP-citrate lyase beta-subunit
MPRQKLSEYRAKTIIHDALGLQYAGWPINATQPLDQQTQAMQGVASNFVVKVDEAVKGRFKKGLVKLDVPFDGLGQAVSELKSAGYTWMIAEPMVSHEQADERYLSMNIGRDGLSFNFTDKGGVDVEQHADDIKHVVWQDGGMQELVQQTGFSQEQLNALVSAFKDNYFSVLEINTYTVADDGLHILDAAVEVDDAGMFFEDSWQAGDIRRAASNEVTPEEKLIEELDANSPASLKLNVLEPNGSVFLLLSGGGASVVVADEIYNQGYGKQLANYGEYSGNPNTEETYAYTKAILGLLLKSNAKQKVVFIGGAVANFTDVAKTFAGVIRAIDETSAQLQEQQVKVFVRRGGPNQETGLAKIESTLQKYGLLGAVHDPSTPLTVAVNEALKEVPHD